MWQYRYYTTYPVRIGKYPCSANTAIPSECSAELLFTPIRQDALCAGPGLSSVDGLVRVLVSSNGKEYGECASNTGGAFKPYTAAVGFSQ